MLSLTNDMALWASSGAMGDVAGMAGQRQERRVEGRVQG